MELSNFSADSKKSEESLASKFEDGLHIDIQEKIVGGTPNSVREVYLKAGHAERMVNKRRAIIGEKRKGDSSENTQNNSKKGNFNHNPASSQSFTSSKFKGGFRQEAQPSPQLGSRHYQCKRCTKNHPGRDCEGNKVTCYECGKLGHRAYEWFRRLPGSGSGNKGNYNQTSSASFWSTANNNNN